MTSAPRTENRMMRQVCCCLCEPWVNVLINLFGAAERRPRYLEAKICLTNLIALPSPITLEIDAVAAARLRTIIFDATQGSQSLALGLALAAASQLVGESQVRGPDPSFLVNKFSICNFSIYNLTCLSPRRR